MRVHVRWFWLAIGMLSCVYLIGCRGKVGHTVLDIQPDIINLPEGMYQWVAWLEPNVVSFAYAAELDAKPSQYEIGIYRLDKLGLELISIPYLSKCLSSRVRWLSKLPDGRLGVINNCSFEDKHKPHQEDTLYAWDVKSNELVTLQVYPWDFHTTDYALSPDLLNMFQSTLEEKLYQVNAEENLIPILADFARISSPAWSPDGSTVAFAGTEVMPESPVNIYSALPVNEALPWDLYLMNPDGSNRRIVISGVKFASHMKWAPGGSCLAFRGEYQGLLGVWVYDFKTMQLTRVWGDEVFYDWSPDGRQMALVERLKRLEVDGIERTRPVIIDLPNELCDSSAK